MGAPFLRMFLMIAVIAIIIVVPIVVITKIVKKLKASGDQSVIREGEPVSGDPQISPCIFVEYAGDGGLLEDGKCGWLDIECEDGEENTVTLNFNKKAPVPITVPLKIAKYRITYRAKSKASLAAAGILRSINEENGAMGAFANAVYDAGEINGQLSSVVVQVDKDFVLKLRCSTDGIEKRCEVVSVR